MKESVIIVAGGTGSRMNSAVPKQFLKLAGKPVIVHTIGQFYKYNPHISLCVVVHKDFLEHWSALQSDYFPNQQISVCVGGETRFHSVKNGLAMLSDSDVIGIHDAARPLVSVEVIKTCFDTARAKQTAIPVIPVHESMRVISEGSSAHVDRSKYRLVQTPQCFNAQLLKDAYKQAFLEKFTDDASVVEAYGSAIHLVKGNRENIKITEPADLKIAEGLV